MSSLSVFCWATALLASKAISRHRKANVFLMSVVNNFIFLYFHVRLLHDLPDRVSGSGTDGCSRVGQGELVPRKFEKSFLIGALPVWVRTAVDVIFNDI